MRLPPSPAPSACDSLDGIDDLDAFLASQGSLSHFPTPPLARQPLEPSLDSAFQLYASSEPETSPAPRLPDQRFAQVFAGEVGISLATSPFAARPLAISAIAAIADVLIRSSLPLETLALALNLLTHLPPLSVSPSDAPAPQLLVLSSLLLAAAYTNDHPPPLSWWSSYVARAAFSPQRIDSAALHLLSRLDFQLHRLARPEDVDQAVQRLLLSPRQDLQQTPLPRNKLRVCTDPVLASGFDLCAPLTPDDTPPASAVIRTVRSDTTQSLSRFLQLL